MARNKEWWLNNSDGRKIGYMWPEDFSTLLEAHYGDTGWVAMFAAEFGVTGPTIYRYLRGEQPIPKAVAMIVHMLGTLSNRGISPEPVNADWLPGWVPPVDKEPMVANG